MYPNSQRSHSVHVGDWMWRKRRILRSWNYFNTIKRWHFCTTLLILYLSHNSCLYNNTILLNFDFSWLFSTRLESSWICRKYCKCPMLSMFLDWLNWLVNLLFGGFVDSLTRSLCCIDSSTNYFIGPSGRHFVKYWRGVSCPEIVSRRVHACPRPSGKFSNLDFRSEICENTFSKKRRVSMVI